MPRRHLQGLVMLLLLSGCTAYDPTQHYDQNAAEKIGFITAKSLVKVEKIPAKPKGSIIFVPLNGALRGVYIPSNSRHRYQDIYEYQVAVAGGEIISVLDVYPAYNVGDCAKVLVSMQPTYPRITSGSGCANQPQKTVVVAPANAAIPKDAKRTAYGRVHEEIVGVRNLQAFAQCRNDARCINVAMVQNQEAAQYLEDIVATIRVAGQRVASPTNEYTPGEKTVKISVLLASDGAIKARVVAKTSGDRMADRWATRLLLHAEPYPPFTPQLGESADSLVSDLYFKFENDRFLDVSLAW